MEINWTMGIDHRNTRIFFILNIYSRVEPKFSHKRIRHTCEKFVRIPHIRVKISYENFTCL